jgi:hypothetical protein
MTCCEMCGEITECTQQDVHGELTMLCQNCPIAEPLEQRSRATVAVESTERDDEYEETLI